MSSINQIFIGVIGAGGVGTHFLNQLAALQDQHPNISLLLISRSTQSLRGSPQSLLSLQTWHSDLAASTTPPSSISDTLTFLSSLNPHGKTILIDNTSNQALANAYPTFLSHGISIVTPNKKAFSSSLDLWREIQNQAYRPSNPSNGLIYHESSVGAGLPIISTLKDLIDTGDTVNKIEGVFSGTMSFLFNTFAPVSSSSGGAGAKWSAVVTQAKDLGYTEPDPRDDLNGIDVARKLVILARLLGLSISSTDAFPVQSLIPTELANVRSGEEFLARLSEFDTQMEEIRESAGKQGKVVRYVGSIDVASQAVKVGLEKFDKEHPIAGLKGSDNIVSFYTERYGSNPLVVQGAGAGGAVTAMGVTADLIKVIQRIS